MATLRNARPFGSGVFGVAVCGPVESGLVSEKQARQPVNPRTAIIVTVVCVLILLILVLFGH
jgi:hypothetical protein